MTDLQPFTKDKNDGTNTSCATADNWFFAEKIRVYLLRTEPEHNLL